MPTAGLGSSNHHESQGNQQHETDGHGDVNGEHFPVPYDRYCFGDEPGLHCYLG